MPVVFSKAGIQSCHTAMPARPFPYTTGSASITSLKGANIAAATRAALCSAWPLSLSYKLTLWPASNKRQASNRPTRPAPTIAIFILYLLVKLASLGFKFIGFFLHFVFYIHQTHGLLFLVTHIIADSGSNEGRSIWAFLVTHIIADILSDFHRAKLWSTHGAKMRHLTGLFRHGLIVIR